jgi:hypothetical protein
MGLLNPITAPNLALRADHERQARALGEAEEAGRYFVFHTLDKTQTMPSAALKRSQLSSGT